MSEKATGIVLEIDRDSGNWKRQMPATIKDLNSASSDELSARQKLLEEEIQANEDETALFQRELNGIFAEQDRRRQ